MRHAIQTMSFILLTGAVLGGCDYKFQSYLPKEVTAKPSPDTASRRYPSALAEDKSRVTDNTDAVAIGAKANASYHAALKERDKLQTELTALLQNHAKSQQEARDLSVKLASAEKELAEANTMLLEMKEELMKWKKDVLSFRSEMRQSQKAMLDGLTRLHVLISGGVASAPPPTQTTALTAPIAPIATKTKEKNGANLR